MKKRTLIALSLAIGVFASGCSAGKTETEATAEATAVQTAPAQIGSIADEYTYSGTVKPLQEINVLCPVSGKVSEVYFDVGDPVNEGDILFKLDTEDIQNNVNVLEASLAAAEANVSASRITLETVNGSAMQIQIASVTAALTSAEASYNNAKTAYENNTSLYAAGAISKTVMDQTENAFKQAEAGYEQAKTTYDMTVNQMPEENMKKAQEGLKAAEASRNSVAAQLESARKSLREASVKSPITGVVSASSVTAGEFLSQTAPPFTVIQMESVNIEVNVSEEIVNSLAPGQEVSVRVTAASPDYIKGNILTVSPAAGQTGGYAVKVRMENPGGLLKSGMFGEVVFVKEQSEESIVVPRDAVINKNGDTWVFVESGGLAEKRTVKTGMDNGNVIEILEGVTEGENIVVKGQTYLADGDSVNVAGAAKGE